MCLCVYMCAVCLCMCVRGWVGEGVLRAQIEDLAQTQRPQDSTPADGAVGTSLKEATPGLLET